MKKEELVHLHILLAQFKRYCEENHLGADFNNYTALDIPPLQVHRNKEEHKRAILVLATELAVSLQETNKQSKNENPSKTT